MSYYMQIFTLHKEVAKITLFVNENYFCARRGTGSNYATAVMIKSML